MPRLTSKYRGYSTVGTSFLNPSLADLALAKQDLLNHLNTRRGERIMMPNFGSIVWDMLFEPLDDTTIALIDADIRSIVKNDPRWRLNSVNISENPNALTIEIRVTYLPASQEVILPLTYNKGTNTI